MVKSLAFEDKEPSNRWASKFGEEKAPEAGELNINEALDVCSWLLDQSLFDFGGGGGSIVESDEVTKVSIWFEIPHTAKFLTARAAELDKIIDQQVKMLEELKKMRGEIDERRH
jgi:hypothetical protein